MKVDSMLIEVLRNDDADLQAFFAAGYGQQQVLEVILGLKNDLIT